MSPDLSLQRLASLPWGDLRRIESLTYPSLTSILSGQSAAKELSILLRRNPGWSSNERRIVAETLFGVALWRRRLAHILEDDWQRPNKPPDEYLQALILGANHIKGSCSLSADEQNAASSVVSTDSDARLRFVRNYPPKKIEELATFYSFPDWIAESFTREFGDEAPSLADALNLPGPVFVRVNKIKQTIEGLRQRLLVEGVESEPCQFATDALRLTSPRPNIYGLQSYQRGEFEVQDEGSQLLALLLEVKPNETIVDYCAGAGGKTLAFASQMRDRGRIIAFDIDGERLSRLSRRAKNAGATCIEVCQDEANLPTADAVFVDAPCSELGALRRGPDMRFRLDAKIDWPERQYEILQRASRLVRAGGRLVYATCTLRREENQDVVARFLLENRNFQMCALPVYSRFYREGFFTSLPHQHGTDGFFAAVLLTKGASWTFM